MIEQFGLDLDDVEVTPAGKRRLVRVVVDGDGPDGHGPLLDDIAEATRAISAALDDTDLLGNAGYTLEVSSRGVSRPLTLPRHWRRNADRLVLITLADGGSVLGRVRESDEASVLLETEDGERRLGYDEIGQGIVQVELNRKRGPEPETEPSRDRARDRARNRGGLRWTSTSPYCACWNANAIFRSTS